MFSTGLYFQAEPVKARQFRPPTADHALPGALTQRDTKMLTSCGGEPRTERHLKSPGCTCWALMGFQLTEFLGLWCPMESVIPCLWLVILRVVGLGVKKLGSKEGQ